MATVKEGILGGLSGQVGPVVGASWKGIPYVRSLPSNWKDAKTEKQVRQRSRFIATMNFLRGINPFIRVGFQADAEGRMSAFNAAMSYNMKHALREGEDGLEMDYPLARVSEGPLDAAPHVQMEIDGCTLRFGWKNEQPKNGRPDDMAMVLAYNPAKRQSAYDINAAKRESRQAQLPLPADWVGDVVETYLAFRSAVGNTVSRSTYAGRGVVAG